MLTSRAHKPLDAISLEDELSPRPATATTQRQAAFELPRPGVVLDTAADKLVPLMGRNTLAFVVAVAEGSIWATWQFALAAQAVRVGYFILRLTDRVVRRASAVGATKRMAELSIQALQKSRGTRSIKVRFGNGVGSSGSLFFLFAQQIAPGCPVSVTQPEMQRLFMTAPEAGQLVFQSLVLAKKAQIVVPDMEGAAKTFDLARRLIHLSGFRREQNIKNGYSGARLGEKLFEGLNLSNELLVPTGHARVKCLRLSASLDRALVHGSLKALGQAVGSRARARIFQIIDHLIHDFSSALTLNQRLCRQAQA